MKSEARLLRALHSVITRLVSQGLETALATYQLSVAQYHTLQYLAHVEQSDISGIASAFSISVPAATKMVDRLQAAGWVERRPSEQDRRHVIVVLTESGQAVIDDLAGKEADSLAQVLAKMGEEQRAQLFVGGTAFVTQAREMPEIEGLCLFCGKEHTDDCPLCGH
ncbi:MAG: MarR family transcriptional regulator [Firmicutes bacterium]|nr:MarR family transcriptional regulator [Bacillota bacterium]